MSHQNSTLKAYQSLILLVLITFHAFLMNGYYPSHRQMTVGTYFSSIRAMLDPSLFKNSIYIQAVERVNLRIGMFYDIAPFILQYVDFEAFALLQALISLFFVIVGIYSLTKEMFNSDRAGYIASLLYTVELNRWTLGSPSPYLNFFHHGLPYAYPLGIWSIFFFYKKRYLLASLLTGIAWNFHPMFTIFLLFAYFVYWIFNRHEFRLPTVIKCIALFLLLSFPYLVKSFLHLSSSGGHDSLWLKGVMWVSSYSNFPSAWSLSWLVRAGLFFILTCLCLYQIHDERLKKWILCFYFSVACLCFIGTWFAEISPQPFFIKLSLWRSTVLYLILALACIAGVTIKFQDNSLTRNYLVIMLLVLLTGYFKAFKLYYLPFALLSLAYALYERVIVRKISFLNGKFPTLFFSTFLTIIFLQWVFDNGATEVILFSVFAILFFISAKIIMTRFAYHTVIPIVITFILLFDLTVLYSKGGPEIYFHGTMQGKIDPWANLQLFAKEHSHKDDLFIVPPYMNDFYQYSLRAVLGDWAEGSTLIYLDNRYTEEWFERMNAIGWNDLSLAIEGYKRLSTKEIQAAADKYGARFVVTEKPNKFNLPVLYENEKYILYKLF